MLSDKRAGVSAFDILFRPVSALVDGVCLAKLIRMSESCSVRATDLFY